MRAVESEADTFLRGRGVGTGFTQAEGMTISGPFGGPAPDMLISELTAVLDGGRVAIQVSATFPAAVSASRTARGVRDLPVRA